MVALNAIRRIQVVGSSSGLDETTAKLDALSRAQTTVGTTADGMGVKTETSARRQLSMASAYDRLIKSVDDNYRAQQRLAAGQAVVQKSFDQGIIDASEYAQSMQKVADKFDVVSIAAARQAAQLAQQAAQMEKAAAQQKAAAQAMVDKQTVVPDRGVDVAAYAKQLDDLRAKYSPLYAASRSYKDVLTEINQAARVGAISETERAAAVMNTKVAFVQQVNSLRGVHDAQSMAAGSATKLGATIGLNANGWKNLGFQVNDAVTMLASGSSVFQVISTQGGQVYQALSEANGGVGGALKSITTYLGSVFTIGRIAFGGLAAAIGVAGMALNSYLDSQLKVQLALTGAGRASGATASGINAVGSAGSAFGLSVSSARDLASALAATGKVANDNLLPIVKIGRDFATTFGVDAVDATKMLASAFADPVKGAEQLNDRLGFLDAAMQRQIASLVAQNRMYDAQQVLLTGLQGALARTAEVTSIWSQMWVGLKNGASNFFDYVGEKIANGLGLNKSLQDQADQLKAGIASYETGMGRFFGSTADLEILKRQLADVNALIDKRAQATQNVAAAQASMRVSSTVFAQLPDVAQRQDLATNAAVGGAVAEDPVLQRSLGISQDQANRVRAITQQIKTDYKTTAEEVQASAKIALDSVTAFSPAAKALIAARQATEQYRAAGGLDPGEKAKIAQDAYNVSLAQSVTALSEAARARELSANQAVASAQLDVDMVGKSIGQQAEMRANLQARQALEQQLLQIHGKWGPAQDAELAKLSEINKKYAEQQQLAAIKSAQSSADFTSQTMFMSQSDLAAAQVMNNLYGDKWQSHMDDALAKQVKMNSLLGTAKDYADTFGQALTQAFASGKSGSDALSAAVSAIGTKMSSDLMTKATSNIVSGATSMDPSQLASGGLQAVAAIGISWLQGQAAKAKQAQADFKAAQDAWTAMAGEVTKFKDQMLGTNTGSLGAAIGDATDKAQSYADAAHKAGQATGDLTAVLVVYVQRMTRDFMNTFDTTIEALNEGLGMDSPAVKAAANVKGIGDTLKGFIDDTVKAGEGLGTAAPAIAAATAASQSYALTLLQTPPVLTTVQTSLLTLRGNAQQLQTTLQDLGMSADDAGTAISNGIKSALASISATFAQGLQAQINSANGKDYINQINALLATGAGNLSDAQSLGMDPSLVAQAFQAQAQQIIDSAGLVGSAFDAFIDQFPQLAGVVNQSTTAIKELSDATTQFYASLRTTISTYLHNLNIGTQSALSPQDRLGAAQTDYNKQLALAQGGDRDALGSITQYSSDLLNAAKDYYASSAGYADILAKVQAQLTALPSTAEAGDPVVEQLKLVTNNTGNTVATLAALQSIQVATQTSSVDISSSVTQLGAQAAYVAEAQGSQYFGPMNAYLSQIAANTLLSGNAAAKPDDGVTWWNPFTWFAEGGSVTGGTPGKDSVMAMLTPNEFVVKPGPADAYLPLLQAMNAGKLPPLQHFAEGGSVLSTPAPQLAVMRPVWANDNQSSSRGDQGQHFNALASTIVRAMAGVSMTEIGAMREENAALRAAVNRLTRAVEANKPAPRRAGTREAA